MLIAFLGSAYQMYNLWIKFRENTLPIYAQVIHSYEHRILNRFL